MVRAASRAPSVRKIGSDAGARVAIGHTRMHSKHCANHAPDPAELLAALLEGLDVPTLRIEALTPSLMSRIGALLRESTRGTIELLAARAVLKREVRAKVTVIVARENNPLKFSPTVEIALQHLLGPLEKGFTPPVAAMQDAFDDLRAHHIGMLAGVQPLHICP